MPLSHESAADSNLPAWLTRGFVLASLLMCALAFAMNRADPDLWGHVRYAQDVLTDGVVPATATYTFTAQGHRWINHENLSEIAFALVYQGFGTHGLLVFKCLLGMTVTGLMLAVAHRQGVNVTVMGAFLLLIATNLTTFWPVRPQIMGYGLFAVLLVLLGWSFENWQERRRVRFALLCLGPPLFAVWANTHGGFVAGLCIMSVYLFLRSLEATFYLGRQGWGYALQFGVIIVCCGLATLITPYGPELWVWLVDSLGHPRPEITEWASPSPSHEFFVPFWSLVGVVAASWMGSRVRRDWTHILILALTIVQAALHLRHIAFVAILCGFWLPPHVQSLVSRLREGMPQSSRTLGRNARWGLAAVLGLALCLPAVAIGQRLSHLPVLKWEYPIDAVQYMADRQMTGKLVVSFNWAQYTIAALTPEVQVAFDGRFRTCYPQEVVDMHFDFLMGDVPGKRHRSPQSGPVDGSRVLHFEDPDLVLMDRSYKQSVRVMRVALQSPDPKWTLLYQDGLAQLWGRRDRYDDPQSPHFIPESERFRSEEMPVGWVQWPAMPRRKDGLGGMTNDEMTNDEGMTKSEFRMRTPHS